MLPTLRARSFKMLISRKAVVVFTLMFLAAAGLIADAPATNRPADILSFLNQTVVWYRLLASQQELVREPSDAVFLNENRQIADQVVRLAFEFARAEAQQVTVPNQGAAPSPQGQPSSSQYQNLINLTEKSNQQISSEEKQLASLKQQLTSAAGKKRAILESEIAETEDELELLKARHETLQNMLQFASGMTALTGAKGLQAQIEELARTVPAAITDNSKGSAGISPSVSSSPSTVAPDDRKGLPTGIFGLITEVFDARSKISLLDHAFLLTDSLADA